MNYALLLEAISTSEYTDLGNAEATAKLNALRNSVTFTTIPLPRRVVKSWLLEKAKLETILTGTDDLSKKFAFLLTDPDYTDIPIFDPLTQYLFGLAVQAGMFTAEEKAELEEKARVYTQTNDAREMLGQDVTETDIARARLQPKIDIVAARRDAFLQSAATQSALLAELQAGVDVAIDPVDGDAADTPAEPAS